MTKLWSALGAVPSLLIDMMGLGGVGLVSYGSWLVYEPAGFIVAGILFIAGALALGRTPGSAD